MSRRQDSATSTEIEMPTEEAILRILLVPEDRRHEPTFWTSKPIPSDRKPRRVRLRLWRR